MSVAGYPTGQQPVLNGLLPHTSQPRSKRPLEGPDAQHALVPYPSQRQRPPDSYWPPNEPSTQNETPRSEISFYMVGQRQQQIQHDFSLGAVGQAAPPPLEAVIMGLADPATAARKRAEMVAKLDRLTPETIKALLLEASLRHFTVADQVGLEHDKIATLGPHAAAPVAANNHSQRTYTQTNPQPTPLAEPASPPPPSPPPRRPIVRFDRYHRESLREMTRHVKRSCSQQFELAFDVHYKIGKMFAHMSSTIDENDAFETKASALRAMLSIWDNCFEDGYEEIGKKLRNECDMWVEHMWVVMETLDDEDFLRLAYDSVDERSEAVWCDYAERSREIAEGYNPILADALAEAIYKVRFEAGLEEEEFEEEEEEEDYEEEEDADDEPSAVVVHPAYASAGGTRAQPVVLY